MLGWKKLLGRVRNPKNQLRNLNLIYWVGSNLLITPRGTAQKMHILYNGIYITKITKSYI